MNRRMSPVLFLGATTLLVALTACQRSARDASADSAATRDSAATASASAPAGGTAAGSAAAGTTTQQGSMLDPNTAAREQLLAVPGMNAAAADALIAGRPYNDMLAVDRVLARQMPDTAARKTVYAQLWKPLDLNSAKGEEITLIPGVGPRMRHEFEEYRPYTNIQQFRREIGKYVDKNEVARLERYVTIRR